MLAISEPRLEADLRVVRAVAARLVGDGEADDIVQETLIRALVCRPDTDAPLRPWLVTVARRIAFDWLRRRGRMRFVEVDDGSTVDEPPASLRDLLGGLGHLTRGEVGVLLLRDGVDLSVDEVAVLLATSPGTVRVLHHRARRKAAGAAAPDLDGLRALDTFVTWLLARAAIAPQEGEHDPLLHAGVIDAVGRLLDAVVDASADVPAIEARARLSRGAIRRLTAPNAALADVERAKALGADPSLADATLAELFHWLERDDDARAAAERVVERGAPAALVPRMHAILSSGALKRGDAAAAARHVALARLDGVTVDAATASGLEHLLASRYAEADVAFRSALALCRQRGGSQEPAILINLGVVAIAVGRHDEATAWLTSAAALARSRGDVGREGTAIGNLGTIARHQGRFADAVVLLHQAIGCSQRAGRPAYVELWKMNLAIVDLLEGRLSQAHDGLATVVGRFEALGAASDAAFARQWLLAAQILLGEATVAASPPVEDRAPSVAELFACLARLDTPEGRARALVCAAAASPGGAEGTAAQIVRVWAERRGR